MNHNPLFVFGTCCSQQPYFSIYSNLLYPSFPVDCDFSELGWHIRTEKALTKENQESIYCSHYLETYIYSLLQFHHHHHDYTMPCRSRPRRFGLVWIKTPPKLVASWNRVWKNAHNFSMKTPSKLWSPPKCRNHKLIIDITYKPWCKKFSEDPLWRRRLYTKQTILL